MDSTAGSQGRTLAHPTHGAHGTAATTSGTITVARLRTSYIWLAALAAACLFGLVFTASSQAYLTKLTHSGLFQDRNAGAGSNYVMSSTFGYSGSPSDPKTRGDQGDDLRYTLFDWPTGLVGNPNAVRPTERCAVGDPALIPEGSQGQSYNYFNCPASAKVGTIEVDVAASVNLILWWQECPMTMTGNVYLLRNYPTVVGTPEVPTYVGIAIGGSAGGLCDLAGSQDMTMTAKITVRDEDQGLRIQMVDGMPRTKSTSVGNANIRVNAIRQTLNAKAANGNIFMRNPSRCLPDKWTSSILAATWDGGQTGSNLPAGTSLVTIGGITYVKANNVQDATPVCARLPEFQPSIKVENKNKEAGAAVGIKATLQNPADPNMTLDTGATPADFVNYLPPGIKKVSMAMPKDFRVNPAVGERLGTAGCTDAQFDKTHPQAPVNCPNTSEIGTNAVTVPHITGDLFGKLYLGQPHSLDYKLNNNQYGTTHKECVMSGGSAVYWNSTKPCDSDENEGIFRLYQSSKRGGVAVKFEGRAVVNQDKNDPNYGQISVEFGDPSYSPAESPGLPQFSYSKFILDFDSASTGVGKNPDGSNIVNPVHNPDPDRQMMMNPQVCGEHPMDTTFTPWSTPAQGEKVVSNTKDGSQESLRVEQAKPDGYPGGADRCKFKPFNPTFSVRLTDDYTYTEGVPDSNPNSMPNKLAAANPVNGVGMHPTMTFSVTRQDRMDNFKDLQFVMPEGFGGSIKSALKTDGTTWSCPMNVLDDVAEGRTMKDAGVWKKNGVAVDCLAKAKIGTVRVKTGAGPAPVTIYGDIVIIDRNDYRGLNPTGVDKDMAGVNELTKYTAKLAVVTPADVGPFRLGAVVNKLYMKLNSSDKFQLVSQTAGAGLDQSIRGIPVLYQEITLKLDGINKQGTGTTADDRPFLFLPSKCHVSLEFQGRITSFGMPPATGPDTAFPNSTPVGAATTSPGTNCNAQHFDPTVQVAFGKSTPATPSNMSVTVNVPQTEIGVTNATVQQSTINRVRVQFPPGIEMNPAVAENLEACPTAAINADIANPEADTNTCASDHPKSKLGDVFVNTPLLPDLPGKNYAVDGAMYLEQQGPTADTRMRFVLYLAMPGGMQVVRGGARVAGSTDGPTAGLGSTAETTGDISVIDGTPLTIGQIESDFNGLPDVTYGWMRLEFNGAKAPDNHIVPMFLTPETCGTHFTRVRVNSSNEQADTNPDTWPPGPANKFFNTATPNLSFNTAADGTHPCKNDADFGPEADITVDINSHDELNPAIAGNATVRDETARQVTYHPNMKASILRADMQKDLRKTVFHLPAGMTGAPTATTKCSVADAANANCQPKSVVGAVEVELGSGADTIVIDNGKIYNTEPASADEPARLTTIATIQLGPFDLGKMSIPILASLRPDDGGLDATVTLPQRFEGIKTHYRRLSMIMYGMADQGTPDLSDDKPFLTNPSRCGLNTFTLEAWDDVSPLNGPSNAQADNTFNTRGCAMDFPAGSLPTMDLTPTSTDSEAPTGLEIKMTNGTATSFNPTIKSINIEFPHGMTVNPAVGLDGEDAACDSALVDAGGSGCPAASQKGEVHVKTPLLAGTFDGELFLEKPLGNAAATRYRLAMIVHLPGSDLVIRGSNLINGGTDLTGPTGAVDSGTGVITAAFNDLVDLPFHELTMELYGGSRALLVNPPTCGSVVMKGEIAPHSGTPDDVREIKTFSSYDVTGCESTPPAPTFSASLSPGRTGDTMADATRSAGHPNFNLSVGNLGKSPQIQDFNLELPSGFVADTVQTDRCSRSNADTGNCGPESLVGSVQTTMGPGNAGAEQLTLAGGLYNVVPESSDVPAQLQVIMGVDVGPFHLGKLSIPVYTEMRKDYGITTKTHLPYRYEGIDVYVRSMTLTVNGYVNGKPFMINPTECGTHTLKAHVVRRSGPTVDPITETIQIDNASCPRGFTNPVNLSVTPSTTETAVPVGLKFDVSTTIDNPTLKKVAMTMPEGLELNPAVAKGLTVCPSAEINNNGGAACEGTTAEVGDVDLVTPLLPAVQHGKVFLEEPIGNDADTRYRTAIVVHLPGKDLIARGEVKIDGSSTIPTGGKGARDTGTGRISTVFWGDEVGTPLPDLAFSTMSIDFHSGPRAMFLNPRECKTASFDAVITAHGGDVTANASDSYTTTNDCAAPAFNPTFDVTPSTTQSAANPELELKFVSPAKDAPIKKLDIDLPTGLVAATGNVPTCSTTQADQGNCTAASDIGDISASIGASNNLADDYEITGDLFNVAPQPGEPARLSGRIDVQVGPYDLGKLTIPITADLRHDWGVTTHAEMPARYEGIAVNARTMTITLASAVDGKGFAINPSVCQSNTVDVRVESHAGQVRNLSDSFTTTGCAPFNGSNQPSIDVTPSTTQANTPVGLRIDVNASQGTPPTGAPTIKRTEVVFPEGLEINAAFAKDLVPCTTATINGIISSGTGDCTGATKIADVTMTTHLMSSRPQGALYLETPGTTKNDRYRVALVLDLPGPTLVVRGAIDINGSTTIPSGGVGSTDETATGQMTAVFDDIPDLGFTQMRLDFTGGSKAMMVNPVSCTPHEFTAKFTPNSVATQSTATTSYTPTGCGDSFAPSFTASVTSTQSAGHPDLLLEVKNAANQQELHKLNVHLPVGLVANTKATPTRCAQLDATNGSCDPSQVVGTFETWIGSTDAKGGIDDRVHLAGGNIYNVTPGPDEPARMQAVMAVAVGPFDLGKLSIPVETQLNPDMSVDAETLIPTRYEGIAVKVREMKMHLYGTIPGGDNFMINPSRCATHTITGEMTSAGGLTHNGSSSFTTTNCPPVAAAYSPNVSFNNTPKTAGAPTNLDIGMTLPASGSTTSNVKMVFPEGLEISPGAGADLEACDVQVADGGASCPANSKLAEITLETPLLDGTQHGELYLEPSIGRAAATRFRLAMVVHLPGQHLVVRGGTLVDGSSDLQLGQGAKDTGNGQITAEFPGLPDLGFSDLQMTFNGSHPLFVNPKTAGTFTINAALTPHAGSTPVNRTGTITTTGGTSTLNGFDPQISGSLAPSTTGGNPDLNVQITNGDGMNELKSFDLHLPEGLVARTQGVPQCDPEDAAANNCDPDSVVGTVETTIGSTLGAGGTLAVDGEIVNVVPDGDQPARLFALIPVKVGPFDLGDLTVDVPTKLNSDMTVTASTELPSRYEGIAVRVRGLEMTIEGHPAGGTFMTAPSKCGPGTVTADFKSDLGESASDSFGFNVTGCPQSFATDPEMEITAVPAVRNAPTNLTFKLTSSADNPTIGSMRVEMPDDMEINPAFGDGLEACSAALVDAGGAGCPAKSMIGAVTLRTHLLDPDKDYYGDVYLVSPGNTAATRFKIAIVAHMPGADLVVHGKVTVVGATDIPTGGTGSTAYAGPGKIIAEFDEIPDLGFTELTVSFNTNRPMLINPPEGGLQTFQVRVSPHSANPGQADADLTPSYTTSGGTGVTMFNPTFGASVSDTTAAGHPDLTLIVNRTNNNSEPIKNLDISLPVGLVASTLATDLCDQADAVAGNCDASTRVGTFTTRFGNGSTAADDLELGGEIYNVTPDADQPAQLSAMVDVQVGPYDMGKLAIAIDTQMNADASISTTTELPTRYEGIAVRIKQMQITLFGMADQGTIGDASDDKPFMQNPSKCGNNAIRAKLTSTSGATLTKQANFTTTGCPASFGTQPGLDVSVSPSETSVPTSLGVEITNAADNPTIGKIAMNLPAGMSVNAAVGNTGNDLVCSTTQLDTDHHGCPAGSRQGTVELETPLLRGLYTGNIYLEQPLGNDADTRYRLAIALDLPGQQIIVRGSVKIDGSTTIEPGGAGSVDEGTGQVTTVFDAVPDLSFSRMQINFNTGPRAMLTNPDSCGTQTVEASVQPSSGGAAEASELNSTFETSFDGAGAACPGTQAFAPVFQATAASSVTGANTDLTLTVDAGAKDQQLTNFALHLPSGLVADTDATDHCEQADAAAADCDAATQVGVVATELGTGSEVLPIGGGKIYNVTPNSDEPARLAAIVPVLVGPYDLGSLSLPVSTALVRDGSDYLVDATTQIPALYEGIRVRIRQMTMTIWGTAANGNGFIKNPSRCTTGEDSISATMTGSGGSVVTSSDDYPVTGCPRNFVHAPTIAVSGVNGEIEQPTGLTLDINSDETNPTVASIITTLPAGMTLNPGVGNRLDEACTTAEIDAGGVNCPAESVVGSVSMETPLLPGTQTGKVVLETPGSTADDRYKLAVIIDLPGTNMVVRGVTKVDGSSDLIDGMGSTDVGTGQLVAEFDAIPDLNFSHMQIKFDSGPQALLANSSECGPQTVSADFKPQSGNAGTPVSTATDSYELFYDGVSEACPGSLGFSPEFHGSVSTDQAAGNPDLTLTVSRGDKQQQLSEFNLELPPGLVADSVSTPRCDELDSRTANCDPDTIVGEVAAEIGTGTDLWEMGGVIYNVNPLDPEAEPARFAAAFDVEVGPYNLGKLSIPVTAEIRTGANPSDLAISAKTQIPQRYEGIAVRMRSMQIKLNGEVNGTPFMINPSKCGTHTVTAEMKSATTTKNGSFLFVTDGCPAPFNPSIETAVPTGETGIPTGYTFKVHVPGNSSSISAVTTTLPEGFEVNPGVANRGVGNNSLQACTKAAIDAGGATCPPSSKVGSVTLDTPLLPTQRTGSVYLETPGDTPATRYKLAIVIDLPGPDLIVHGQAQVDGTGTGVGGGTGQVSATFDNLPDLQFSELAVTFESGDHALLVSPRACGTYESSAQLTPWSIADSQTPASATVTRSHSVEIDDDCGAPSFGPNFSVNLTDTDQAATTDLTLHMDAGAKDERLAQMTIGLPVGLVANTTAAAHCSQSDSAAGNCLPDAQIGSLTTEVGAGGDPLEMTGQLYNVTPDSDEPARLAAKVDVQVGPYDLGKLVIPVKTSIRPGSGSPAYRQYGIDAETDIPTRFEGVAIQMRSIDMTIDGLVGGNRFMVTPSKCGTHTVTAEFTGAQGSETSATDDFTIGNCASGFNGPITIDASVSETETALPTDFSLSMDSDAANQTISSVSTEMPLGMTINPAFGNSFGIDMSTCPSATIDSGNLSSCADAQIGTVSLVTPLLAGTQTGKIYLEEPGNGAAERYRLAIVVDVPGQKLVVRGHVAIDGSTDLVDGMGSTDETATGQMTAVFDQIPDLGFTNMTVSFDTGTRALLTNPETCGTQSVNATIMPSGGSSPATPSSTYTTSYDGAGAPCVAPGDEDFDPTFNASFSTTKAAGNPDVTFTIARQDKTQQIKQLDLELPSGLVANTVATPRCPLALAELADCDRVFDGIDYSASRVGDVITDVGTGGETLALVGGIYNVETVDNDEPARLAGIIDVQVGPYDLGKLSVPVTAEIIGNTADTLRVLTHTTLPTRYEGIPVRVRAMQIQLQGSVGGNPFMINPSRCDSHTVTAHLTSTLGDTATQFDSFSTNDCASAPYTPSLSASLLPASGPNAGNRAGKPTGLQLGFAFGASSSSTKSIRVDLPEGFNINPGIGTYDTDGQDMTCSTADIDAGGSACSAASRIGTVTVDTPLLPTQRPGTMFLEDPGVGAENRYRLGIYVSLPGSSLVLHGRTMVQGTSDHGGGKGSLVGSGQISAVFDELPDLQISNMSVTFRTTGGGDHALLTAPEKCGSYPVSGNLLPWSRADNPDAPSPASTHVDVVNCDASGELPVNEGPLSLSADFSDWRVGEHPDVTMQMGRPDGNRSIRATEFTLPKGLVGSADATRDAAGNQITCADDAANAEVGNCPAETKVGEIAISIGSSEDPYTMSGDIFNVTAPADKPAKLAFAAHVEVGPYDLGKVVVPIDVNIHPDEYYLWAKTDDMPQRFEGIPVRISSMMIKLFGIANAGAGAPQEQPFMSNPRSCSGDLKIQANVEFVGGGSTHLEHTPVQTSGPDAGRQFTGCEGLSLAGNSIDVLNYNAASYDGEPLDKKPEAPTMARINVHQSNAANQAGMKDMSLALPGFRLSAASAEGTETCSDSRLAAKNCPANSRIGTVWLDTALLPKNVKAGAGIDWPVGPAGDQDPNAEHSLWGSLYLLTDGGVAGDRYKLAIQMTGKTTITIRGTAVVQEDGPLAGEMTTVFKGLPDIPFDDMQVYLTGSKQGGVYKPMLLNPENPSTTDPASFTAFADMVAWSDDESAPGYTPTRANSAPIDVNPGWTKGFAPTVSKVISTTQSGGHPDVHFDYTRADGESDIRNVKMNLPAGFLGSAAAVPLCPLANATAGTCSAASQIGNVSVWVGQFGQEMRMDGQAYLTEGEVHGGVKDIAGMSIKVPAVAGGYNLGDYITQGRVVIRPSDHGVDVNFSEVPRLFKGVPTHIKQMSIDMKGVAQSTGKAFLFNPSVCGTHNIVSTMDSWSGQSKSETLTHLVDGCASRTFAPSMSFTAHGGGVGAANAPAWTIKMGNGNGDSTLQGTTVVLPSAVTINVAGIGAACPPEQVSSRTCSPASVIGSVSVVTPLLPYPVAGTVYMAKSLSASSLPDLLIDIPAPIDMQIRGANSFTGADFNQVQSTFVNVPDLIFSEMTMSIAGGPTGMIMLRESGVCGAASGFFTSHSGQQSSLAVPIIGIDTFCAEQQKACTQPKVKVSTKGVSKKKYKKATVKLSLIVGDHCKPIRSVRVSFPKGSKFNSKLLKYKKTKNKKLMKQYKKNLQNLTGWAGDVKYKSDGFKTSGTRLQFKKNFPANAHSFSIATKNSALLLPRNTFCGKVLDKGTKNKKYKKSKKYKADLKKCRKKLVTFAFEVTNIDGSTYKYNYKVAVGSKVFK